MRLLALRTILVASDLTAGSDAAARTALDLSRASGAELHVIHIADRNDDILIGDSHRAEYLAKLDVAMRRIGAREGDFAMHVADGDVPASIGHEADKLNADVVILGRRRPEARPAHDSPIGGTAHAVMSRSQAPCLAITELLRLPIRKALVAIDTSETARGALLVAVSWVSAVRATAIGEETPTLTALHVDSGISDGEGAGTVGLKQVEHEVSVLRRMADAWAGVTVLSETIEGRNPAVLIADYANDHGSDLVILGTRAPEHREGGLGSVSASVTTSLSIPVLLVPPAVWRDHARDMDYF
ncbi:MAG: universal stress protein [Gemmatimonadaceae bacterium]